METSAVYWEPRVRTYGFEVHEKFAVWQLDIAAHGFRDWGARLARWQEADATYRWVHAQAGLDGTITLWVTCDAVNRKRIASFVDLASNARDDVTPTLHWPVDVLFFQGPHYGDRYGIADYTFKALQRHDIPLLAMICCVNSVTLVLPDRWGLKTKAALSQEFEIPIEKNLRRCTEPSQGGQTSHE